MCIRDSYNPHPIANSGKELSLLIQQAAVYISKAMDELEIFRKKPTELRAVSYTHLDVYKRQ